MNSYFTIQSNRYGLEETLAGADREHPDETNQVLSCGGYRIGMFITARIYGGMVSIYW
jgi:hypothetical protein